MLPCLSRLPFSWPVRSRSSLPFTWSGDGSRPIPNPVCSVRAADPSPPRRGAPRGGPRRAPPPANARPGLSAQEQAALDAAREKEDLVSQVEQLKAKIAAKEKHISAVDAKRSLAVNPLRNRFVDQADLDLYDKY